MKEMQAPERYTVLYVEDESETRSQLAKMIETQGYRLVLARDGLEGLDLFSRHPVDIVLSDIMMPHMDGLDMARQIRARNPAAQIILLTAFDKTRYLLDAIEIGVNQFVLKPLLFDKLQAALDRCREVLDLQRRLEAQHEQIRLLSTALDQSAVMAVITAPDGTIEYVNRKFSEITGYRADEVIGKTPRVIQSGLTSLQEYQQLWSSLLAGQEWRGILRNRKKSGELYWESCSISPLVLPDGRLAKFVKTAEDITERRKEEIEALRTKHLKAVGSLAGGMAHDFNNLLQVILGSISLARQKAEPGSQMSTLLDMAERSSDEARALSRKLLELVNEGKKADASLAVGPIIAAVTSALTGGTGIALTLDLPGDLPFVRVEEDRFRQLMHHLIVNALEAMPTGGSLRVAARVRQCEPGSDLPAAGTYVHIAISDTGHGISPELIERIFDPYFSTKGMGARRGQGLGLALCHSVVDKHGGLLTVESKPGEGTTFDIWLPVET